MTILKHLKNKNVLEDLLMLGLGILLVFLKLMNQLNFYIRKDYFWFTFLAGAVLIITAVIKLVIDLSHEKGTHGHDHHHHTNLENHTHTSWIVLLLIAVVVIGGFISPRRPLSATTATQRTGGNVFIPGTNFKQDSNSISLIKNVDTSKYTIADWIRAFALDPEPSSYINKTVDIEGFIELNDPNSLKVSRFVIACCVVDATPVGLMVDKNATDLKVNDWVHIVGKFKIRIIGDKRELVIDPSVVEKIPTPDYPYL